LTSAAYLWKLCEDGEYQHVRTGRAYALFTSILGAIYACWLIYAAGLSYLLMAVVFIALGLPVYIWARKENSKGTPYFQVYEKYLAVALIFIALFAVYAMVRGIVSV